MIYCVEDEKNIQDLIIYALNNSNIAVQGFSCATDFKQALTTLPKLILLDIMLPDQNGIDLLKELKQNPKTAKIPVIMLTSKGGEYDKVVGLDAGADDYITKPFSVIELIARIKAVLRRSENKTSTMLNHCGLSLDIEKHHVTYHEQPVQLTLKEFELLKKLMEKPNMVLTRERLLEDIWGYDYYGETRTVDVHIRTLRSKLGKEFDYIKTIHGVGYKLEVE
ncbi:MAG: response regulator transcription factor [Erysipelotrichaceae bacterium]